ncbi:hypothetical protein E2C01_018217 [Portunus trituberculatus]|uniref:Uncharacterized protein n=1 Tax=Portunus trituberculatus TaxID=210409 RepID=A0A5B7DVJ6_PORTR|nr:hypothetical protein [Portunus trituberculatus]
MEERHGRGFRPHRHQRRVAANDEACVGIALFLRDTVSASTTRPRSGHHSHHTHHAHAACLALWGTGQTYRVTDGAQGLVGQHRANLVHGRGLRTRAGWLLYARTREAVTCGWN